MSRILKAPYIVVDNENGIPINNKFEIYKEESLSQEVETFEEEHLKEETLDNEILGQMQQEILETAREQADIIIENAKNEANKIIENSYAEIEENANKIYLENKEIGYNEGYLNGENEAKALKNEAEQIISNAYIEKEQIERKIEPSLINLVIDISQKILTKAFEINPEIISLLIKKGLENVKDISNIKIYVSEKQYEYLIYNKDEIIGVDTNKNNIEILKNSSLEDDNCIIETEFGSIQCGAKEQFKGIKEALLYILQ